MSSHCSRPSIGVVSATSTPTGSPDGVSCPIVDLRQVQAALRAGGRGEFGGRSHSGSERGVINYQHYDKADEVQLSEEKEDQKNQNRDLSTEQINEKIIAKGNLEDVCNEKELKTQQTNMDSNRTNARKLSLSLRSDATKTTVTDRQNVTLSPETGSGQSQQSNQSNVVSECNQVCVSPGCMLQPPAWKRNVPGMLGANKSATGTSSANHQSTSSGHYYSCTSTTSTSAMTSSTQPAHFQALAAQHATTKFGASGVTGSAVQPPTFNAVKQAWEHKQRISLSKERKAAQVCRRVYLCVQTFYKCLLDSLSVLLQVLGIVMGAFIACWLPFFMMYVILPFCRNCNIGSTTEILIVWLGYINSGLCWRMIE